jgi:uncharacterized protein
MSDGPLTALRRGRVVLAVALGILLGLLLVRWGVGLYVDALWFGAEEASRIFWTQVFWEWGARLLVGVVSGLLVWINVRWVASTFSGLQIRRRFGDLVIQEQLPRTYIRWAVLGTALFIGLWFLAAVPQGTGLRGLLLLSHEPWGEVDPIFGRDVAFYIFLLPVLQGVVTFGLVMTVFLAGIVAAGYAATGAVTWGNGRVRIGSLPRRHLGILAGVFLFLLGLRFYLAPYGLLLDGSSDVQGIFGYADHHARIGALRFVGFLSLVTAGVVVWGALRERLLPVAAGGAALAVGALAVGEIYPAVVQRLQVQPNELARERPYIEHAVAYTRRGFNLAGMNRQRLEHEPPDARAWEEAGQRLARLPIWTEATLLTTFRQIEARFQYYDFHTVAFDRYPGEGETMEPVAVSVRELEPAGIPDPNWQNLHIRERFISGMGAVAGQLNRRTDEGRLPMFLTAIPPEYRPGPGVPADVRLERPAVYVGTRPQRHAVITPGDESFLSPEGTRGTPGEDFPGGITMRSLPRTAALAWYFQDFNLLLAAEVERESRLVYRRQVHERVRTLAPFLHLPENPYPVIAQGRIYWVLEAFTVSRSFPLSQAHDIGGRRTANYLRNSVKITVDAVTGETNLYVVDGEDPLLVAYRRAFPTLFRDLDEMPRELLEHLRYSRYMLDVQSRVLLQYHQEDPPVFHGQQDQWELATELAVGSQPVSYRPEFALLTLPGEVEESYVLSTVLVPRGRRPLAAFLVGRWTPQAGGEVLLWDAPVEEQIRGPRQIEAMIEQDPEISQQFALWRQAGSEVWTGHLHLVPVRNTLFYMEPIFLAADSDAIPEIRRYVVSDGERVVMDPTLEGAITALAAGLEGVVREGEPVGVPALSEALPEAPPEGVGPVRALELLDEAEALLRDGDWAGFGRKLQELREALRDAARGASPP